MTDNKSEWKSDFDLIPSWNKHLQFPASWSYDTEKLIYELLTNRSGTVSYKYRTSFGDIQNCIVSFDNDKLIVDTNDRTNNDKYRFMEIVKIRNTNNSIELKQWQSDFNLVQDWLPHSPSFPACWGQDTERLVYALYLKKRIDLVSYIFKPSWMDGAGQTCNVEFYNNKLVVDTNDMSNGGLYRYMDVIKVRDNNTPDENDFKNINSNDTCCVCLTNEKSHITIPCMHLCLCLECSLVIKNTNKCPICRLIITDVKKVYG